MKNKEKKLENQMFLFEYLDKIWMISISRKEIFQTQIFSDSLFINQFKEYYIFSKWKYILNDENLIKLTKYIIKTLEYLYSIWLIEKTKISENINDLYSWRNRSKIISYVSKNFKYE